MAFAPVCSVGAGEMGMQTLGKVGDDVLVECWPVVIMRRYVCPILCVGLSDAGRISSFVAPSTVYHRECPGGEK